MKNNGWRLDPSIRKGVDIPPLFANVNCFPRAYMPFKYDLMPLASPPFWQ